ncbi:MAG: 1,2-phenylacetyl-CoA epoxidase subunit PaaE [Rubrivivax sp.]
MSGLHFHTLRVRAVQPDTDDSVVVSFDVPEALAEAFRFEPGQYLTLRHEVEGQDLRRSYSICAAAGETPRVGVRRVPGGAFSSWLHTSLKAGDTIECLPPQGRFGHAVAAGAAPRHVLAIAGGSGITPILSIVKTLLEAAPSTRVTLLYGNRQQVSTMFKEELEDLKNRHLSRLSLYPVFSREVVDAPDSSPLAAGRLDRARIGLFLRTLVDARSVDHAFVCGPHALNDEAEAALLEAGIEPARIHIERFGIPPELQGGADPHAAQAGDADQARIVLVRDGLTREFGFAKGDPSILDAAARAGLDVPYSCKSGVCATCRCKVLEGEVRMDRNFALEPADLVAGFVLSCQAHPLTERVVVSFDER